MKIYVWGEESGWRIDWTAGGVAVIASNLAEAKRRVAKLGGFGTHSPGRIPDPCRIMEPTEAGLILDVWGGA